MLDFTNYEFSLAERGLAVLSLTTASVFATRYALQGSTNIKVTAVALVAFTLIAAIDFIRHAWVSLKSSRIYTTADRPGIPKNFIEFSSKRGSLHWQFTLHGKQVEVKETPWYDSLWSNAQGELRAMPSRRFGLEINAFGPPDYSDKGLMDRSDIISLQSSIDWLETSPKARETNYINFIPSPKESGLILPIAFLARAGDRMPIGVIAAYRAVDLFLRNSNHNKIERITIIFPTDPEGGGMLPKPADIGVV